MGDAGAEVMTCDEIRNHYINKYGSIDKFKEKLRVEREKFIQEVKSKSSE